MPQGVAGGKIERSRTCALSWKCSCFIFSTYCCLHKHYGGKTSPLFFFFRILFHDSQNTAQHKNLPSSSNIVVLLVTPAFIEEHRLPQIKSHMEAKLWHILFYCVHELSYTGVGSLTTSTIFINRLYSCSFTEELDHAAHAYLGSVSRYFWL